MLTTLVLLAQLSPIRTHALVLSELKLQAFREAKAAVDDGGFAQRYFEVLDEDERAAWREVKQGPTLVRDSRPYERVRIELNRILSDR